jgi:prepilin-type N-terminal cleavage/methylation domain-containing protein
MLRNRSMNAREAAFTLVEVLIVIAIIAILAAILITVVGVSRARAQETACSSNLRQIEMSFQMYLDDNDNLRPLYIDNLWPQYLNDKRLLVCPSDKWTDRGDGDTAR